MKINEIISEVKQRLDPKCWTGKKIGNPKTKIKGGVRVNNCVPAESIEEGAVKDQMHDDAERMSREQFVDKYGKEYGEFWDNIMGDLDEQQNVAEAGSQTFDMSLAKVLKQRGYTGPVKLEQLGMKWVEAIGDIVDIDDLIMVQGNDPDYDGWVSYVFGLGKYAYGAEMGYTTGTAKRVEVDTREPDVSEGLEETYDGDDFFEAYGVMWYNEDEQLDEAEYQGRNVPLGKPMQGDVKKFKVYVKDPSTGNIKKVNFGDPNMRIKKSNPARRKSFRARHNCANPGPRTKARYWSCRKW
jgi:hypothetical protein